MARLTTKQLSMLLMGFAFLVYALTLGHDYNLDDELVTKGHRLTSQGIKAIPEIFTSPYYQDDMGYSYEYRPITHVTFAVEHWLFGEHAGVSHCINVLLHSLTVLLVFLFARSMGSSDSLQFPVIAALLFAVHPMHTEAVASIKNRDELLALLFGVGALHNTLIFLDRGSAVRWLAVAILLMLSLLSKTSGAAFLILVPACMLLRKDISSVRLILVFLSAIVTLGLLGTILDVPPHLLKYGGFALITMSTLILMWRLKRKIKVTQVLNFVRSLKPAGWPDSKSGNTLKLQPLELRDLFTALIAIAIVTLGHLTEHPFLQVGLLLILLIAPYWKGQYRLGILLLIAVHCLQLSLVELHPNRSIGTLLPFLLTLIYLDNHHRLDKYFKLLFTAYLLPFIATEYRLLSPVSVLDFVWFIIALAGPIAQLVIVLAIRKRFTRTVTVLWSVNCTVLLFDFVYDPTENSFFILAGNLLFLIHLLEKWPPSAFRPQHLLSILMVLSALMLTPSRSYFTQLAEKIKGNTSLLEDAPVAEHDVMPPANRKPVKNDRPLEFVEYPIGIESTTYEKLGSASVIMGLYLRKMLVPWPQAFYYGYDEAPIAEIHNPWAIMSFILHLALLFVALYLVSYQPVLSFGILAYLASILLISNLLIPIAGMIGDRLTYVASLGFCLSLAYTITISFRIIDSSAARRILAGVFVVLMTSWLTMTIVRSAEWKDALTLMRRDIKIVNNSSQAHYLLATKLMARSYSVDRSHEARALREEAVTHFKASLRIYPDYFNSWYYLGRACMVSDNLKCAVSAFKEVNRLDSTLFEAPFNVALISDHLNDQETAIEYFKRCVAVNPDRFEPYQAISDLYIRRQQFAEALLINEQALKLHPEWHWAEKNKQFAQSQLELGEDHVGLKSN